MAQPLKGPYNKCAVDGCGFEATTYKYCPFHGGELEHVGPERRCPWCTEVVWYADAQYCQTCGQEL
jgi:hypothetical protein